MLLSIRENTSKYVVGEWLAPPEKIFTFVQIGPSRTPVPTFYVVEPFMSTKNFPFRKFFGVTFFSKKVTKNLSITN